MLLEGCLKGRPPASLHQQFTFSAAIIWIHLMETESDQRLLEEIVPVIQGYPFQA